MKVKSDFEKKLAEILGANNQLASSQLAFLSDLTKKELASFRQAWTKTGKERRRQIISHLTKFQLDDLRLNFTGVFLACLEDSHEDIRSQAIMVLGREEDGFVIPPLIRSLREDESEKVRAAAAIALGQFALLAAVEKLPLAQGAEIYFNLLKAIDDETETEEVKRRCLEAIAPLDSPRVKELIEQGYHSDNIKVKASALCAMGRNCDSVWLPIIIKEKDNNEPEIRYEVAEACGELCMEEAIPTLIELAGDGDARVREASIRALHQINGPRGKEALRQLLDSPYHDVGEAAKEVLDELEIFAGLFDL